MEGWAIAQQPRGERGCRVLCWRGAWLDVLRPGEADALQKQGAELVSCQAICSFVCEKNTAEIRVPTVKILVLRQVRPREEGSEQRKSENWHRNHQRLPNLNV